MNRADMLGVVGKGLAWVMHHSEHRRETTEVMSILESVTRPGDRLLVDVAYKQARRDLHAAAMRRC